MVAFVVGVTVVVAIVGGFIFSEVRDWWNREC